MYNTLELLSPTLIERYPEKVQKIDHLCGCIWKEIGWHYILDLTWILEYVERLNLPGGATIIDAGAGKGILQFLLSDLGYNVLSVDFSPYRIPLIPAMAFPIGRIEGKLVEHSYIEHISKVGSFRIKLSRLRRKILLNKFTPLSLLAMSASRLFGWRKPGRIQFYHTDMKCLDQVKANSIDAVVSLSAMEHMGMDDIPDAVKEFERILKPGAPMIITTSASRDKDWFHQPSKGWCFSELTLKKMFGIFSERAFYDVSEYDKLMEQFRSSQELKRRLSSLYFVSGDNGMPWGRWNPEYLPVGILKKGTI